MYLLFGPVDKVERLRIAWIAVPNERHCVHGDTPRYLLTTKRKTDPLYTSLCFLNTGRWTNSKPRVALNNPNIFLHLHIPAGKRGSYKFVSVRISSYQFVPVRTSSHYSTKPGDLCLMIKIEHFCTLYWNTGYRFSSIFMHVSSWSWLPVSPP
jgi:hypothetical protein